MGLDIKEEVYDHMWGKFKTAIKYMYDHHLDDAEWFYKSDDDAYNTLNNLTINLNELTLSLV